MLAERFYEAMSVPSSDSQVPTGRTNPLPLPGLDNVYKKALLKGDIKIDKLEEHNYQEWSKTMELYLSAKILFDKVDSSVFCPDKVLWPNDHEAWKFDDTQARMWIYANCERSQQVHLRGTKTLHAL